MPETTFKRELAKLGMSALVYSSTVFATETVMDVATDRTEEIHPPRATSQLIGATMALALKSRTDKAVDRVADRWNARKIRKAEKTIESE